MKHYFAIILSKLLKLLGVGILIGKNILIWSRITNMTNLRNFQNKIFVFSNILKILQKYWTHVFCNFVKDSRNFMNFDWSRNALISRGLAWFLAPFESWDSQLSIGAVLALWWSIKVNFMAISRLRFFSVPSKNSVSIIFFEHPKFSNILKNIWKY